jgi:putative ABC transport system substrate-binding protein
MFNPDSAAAGGAIAVDQFSEGCKALNLEGTILAVRDKEAIDNAIAGLSRTPKAGLVLTQDIFVSIHRSAIIGSATRHGVPAVYPFSFFCLEGGLISYGVDVFVGHADAGNYVDRILRGEKPANLPVQQPTKLELVINLKTAKSLGLTVPPSLLARADEVIE